MRRGALLVRGPRPGWAAGGLVMLAACCALSACQGGRSEGEHAGTLQERARKYLELKQKRDWVAIYDGLLDPELHTKLKREAFVRRREVAFDVLGFTVVSAEEGNGGTGRVVAKIDAMVPVLTPQGGTTMIRKEMEEPQKWVARDGRWYIQLES